MQVRGEVQVPPQTLGSVELDPTFLSALGKPATSITGTHPLDANFSRGDVIPRIGSGG